MEVGSNEIADHIADDQGQRKFGQIMGTIYGAECFGCKKMIDWF